jgi:elongation factor G
LSEEEQKELGETTHFDNQCIGTNIPPEFYSSCEKGMQDATLEGALVGSEVEGMRVVLKDGAGVFPKQDSDSILTKLLVRSHHLSHRRFSC